MKGQLQFWVWAFNKWWNLIYLYWVLLLPNITQNLRDMLVVMQTQDDLLAKKSFQNLSKAESYYDSTMVACICLTFTMAYRGQSSIWI